MAKSRGAAMLVGAGDAVGAAVARPFAKSDYTVCICRRDAAKSQALIDERKAEGYGIHASIAEAYWFAHQQTGGGCTHELDLRPSVEKW